MLLEDECRPRGYDRSLVLGLIPCHAEVNVNACIFCVKCFFKVFKETLPSQRRRCVLGVSFRAELAQTSEGMVYTATVYPEKNTSFSSF